MRVLKATELRYQQGTCFSPWEAACVGTHVNPPKRKQAECVCKSSMLMQKNRMNFHEGKKKKSLLVNKSKEEKRKLNLQYYLN